MKNDETKLSFAGETKKELCRLPLSNTACARAEAYGVLLYCNTFTPQEVRIITENSEFAKRLPGLFSAAFGVTFDRLPEENGGKGKLILQITDQEKLSRMIDALGYDPRQNAVLHINFGLLEEDCCRTSFLRGAFLAGGSVTDPEKRYHFELATSHLQASRELDALLCDMGYVPKSIHRGGYRITYFKSSRQIEEILTKMGASLAAMTLMNAKVEKDLRNGINRRVNCDAANVGKTVDAAQLHLAAIRRLEERGMLESLPVKLKETIVLRETYPELSLSELAEEFDPPISKSALNHRLRKLVELSEKP